MTTTEPSIEEALKELREMFPDRDLQVKQSAWRWAVPNPTFSDGHYVKVLISPAVEFKAATLAGCMVQVRNWHRNWHAEQSLTAVERRGSPE